VDRTSLQVTVQPSYQSVFGTDPRKHPLLRRWDHQAGDHNQGGLTLQAGAALVEATFEETPWLNLEDGIQIQFQPATRYRAGDYWLIPARVATGDIEWPRLLDDNGQPVVDQKTQQPVPDALPPHGVEHHYAPLAVVSVNGQGAVSAPTPDLRRTFGPIANAL
jgi:hypothetical protein